MEILKVRNKEFKLFLADVKKKGMRSEPLVPQVSLPGHGGMCGGQRAEAEGRESVRQFGARPGQSDHHAHSEQEEGAEGRTAQNKGAECFLWWDTPLFALPFIAVPFVLPSSVHPLSYRLLFSLALNLSASAFPFPIILSFITFSLLSAFLFFLPSVCFFFPVLLPFTFPLPHCFHHPFPLSLLLSAFLSFLKCFFLFPSFSPVFFLLSTSPFFLPSHPFCLLFPLFSFPSFSPSFLLCLQFAFSLPFCLLSFLMISLLFLSLFFFFLVV